MHTRRIILSSVSILLTLLKSLSIQLYVDKPIIYSTLNLYISPSRFPLRLSLDKEQQWTSFRSQEKKHNYRLITIKPIKRSKKAKSSI